MGLGALINTANTGAYARGRAVAESETTERNQKAQTSFYDTKDSDAFKGDLDKRIADIAGRKAPTVTAPTFGSDAYVKGASVGPVALASGTTIDRSGDLAARAQQQSALSMLAAQAAGKGPSVAGAQMNQSVDQTLAAQSAAMGAGGRTFGGLGARAAMLAGSGALSGAAAQSAAIKAQEANSGAQQFASLSGAMRGADINAAMGQAKLDQETALANAGATNAATMANAGFGQQASLYNAQAALSEAEMRQKAELANVEMVLRARGMNDAAIQSYLAAYQKQFQVDKAGKMGFWDYAQANNQFTTSLQDKKNADAAAADSARMSAFASMLGGVAGMAGGGGDGPKNGAK